MSTESPSFGQGILSKIAEQDSVEKSIKRKIELNGSQYMTESSQASDTRAEDSGDEEMDEGTAEEDELNDALCHARGLSAQQKMRHALTGRGVTLAMLMDDKLLEPGENVMSIEYLGQKFTGDLLPDSRIRWREEDKMFGSPSAWALHCKKIVNPSKKSGCGWASVRYKGRKLDLFKSSWVRKQKPLSSLATHSFEGVKDETDDTEGEEDHRKVRAETEEEGSDGEAEPRLQQPPQTTSLSQPAERRVSVRHAALGRRSNLHNPSTLVECHTFTELGKLQPFSIRVHSNCLLTIDVHSHVTTGEVVGYIGGRWDSNTQYLTLERAYPCKCRLWDLDNAAHTENQIRIAMDTAGLVLVGWYHSHPYSQPDPSLQDIDTQLHYQLNMKAANGTYQPCVAIITSPYNDSVNLESQNQCYWVMPPHEQRPLDYGLPLTMQFEYIPDTQLHADQLTNLESVAQFYRGEPDEVHMNSIHSENTTYMAKLLASLRRKLPGGTAEETTKEQLVKILSN